MQHNKVFSPHKNVEDAVEHYSKKIKENFGFMNLQHQTGIDDVDIKRSETRICIVVGCGIAALVMVGVTLEEFLKTLLKYKFVSENRDNNIEPSLDESEKLSIDANSCYGLFTLHSAIEKCFKEGLITDEEKVQLMKIKEFVRNAFIHSDKSKIFDSNKKGNVELTLIDEGNFIYKENKMMSALGMIFVQGIIQKGIANNNAKRIFEEVDSLIITISTRFWEILKKKKNI